MGSHLGWHFAVCCPLRGGRGEFTIKTPKTIKEEEGFSNQRRQLCLVLSWLLMCGMLQVCTSEKINKLAESNATFEEDWEDWDKPEANATPGKGDL
jgi:hypothetical protein